MICVALTENADIDQVPVSHIFEITSKVVGEFLQKRPLTLYKEIFTVSVFELLCR